MFAVSYAPLGQRRANICLITFCRHWLIRCCSVLSEPIALDNTLVGWHHKSVAEAAGPKCLACCWHGRPWPPRRISCLMLGRVARLGPPSDTPALKARTTHAAVCLHVVQQAPCRAPWATADWGIVALAVSPCAAPRTKATLQQCMWHTGLLDVAPASATRSSMLESWAGSSLACMHAVQYVHFLLDMSAGIFVLRLVCSWLVQLGVPPMVVSHWSLRTNHFAGDVKCLVSWMWF